METASVAPAPLDIRGIAYSGQENPRTTACREVLGVHGGDREAGEGSTLAVSVGSGAGTMSPLITDGRRVMADRTATGGVGITLGGAIVIAGILIAIFWSVLWGVIVALIGLLAFGGFAKGRWY